MKVWVDIDNAPHVRVFGPVITLLRERGAEVEVTSRGRTFVPELLHAAGIQHTEIGRGQPTSYVTKSAALLARSLSLANFAAGRHFDVAIGHGSRSLPPAARMMRVPNLTMFDYEHVSTWLFRRFCDRILVPRAILSVRNGSMPSGQWRAFDGFKEEIYLAGFCPEPAMRARLGVREDDVLVVLRPPSRTAHYHDERSEAILDAVAGRVSNEDGMRVVWLKRDPGDAPHPSLAGTNVIVPDAPLDGPSLLAAADVVISGGGTMNREAALLGTPAYSIFTGPLGALDAELIKQGRLALIGAPEEVKQVPFKRKQAREAHELTTHLREFVVDQIEDVARSSKDR